MVSVLKKITQVAITACLSLSMLVGCGFQLRGDFLLAPELQTLYVSSVDKHGELTRIVKQHLKLNDVNIVAVPKAELPELRILKDELNRRTLSVFPNGQVAEYEIIYTVKYQLRLANQNAQEFSFDLYRDYQDDPNRALAKSRELALLLGEMRKVAADRILRNMATIQIDS
ncbi:LPS assembly lipoprotein LptE [Thalassotalea euphylliae]|uniref:LPS-assembly lipoprotein LptE n=1 Tax=Thalassotalea euphylliae TaxID=1655234 RepID=UPI003636ED57